MSTGILGIALSGLAAFQRSLETTSNNISNVNTEGYSRQRVELSTRPEQYTGQGYAGAGVNVANITRSYDQFITGQVRTSSSAFSEVDSYHALASEIDNMLANEDTGLSAAMKSFFNSIHDVANNPSSTPIRKILLSETDAMASQFNTVGARLDEIKQQVNSNLDNAVSDVNNFASNIAKLNLQIVDAIGLSGGNKMPNELLDQRDELLRKMAEKVDISVVNQQNGSVSVFIGQGQPLVLAGNASTLSLIGNKSDPSNQEIALGGVNITKLLSGGELNGNLRFRDEVLYPAQRQLGLLAVGLATEVNNVHQLHTQPDGTLAGYDLDGNPGVALFDLGTPAVQVLSSARDTGLVASATFQAPTSSSALGTSYRIDVTATGFNMTNLSDNSVTSYGSLASLQAATPAFGFDINFAGGGLTVGDKFEVSPSINAASGLRRNAAIVNPRQIAAATATGLSGDNRNALALANLETSTLMQNGKVTFTQVYGQLVAEVGGMTNTALVSRSAQDVLLEQANTAKQNLSGVNLDEEAANLIKFQNSYQAAAQAASVARSLFDTLIGAVR